MLAIRTALLAQEATSDKENLYPHAAELLVGALAFAIVFYFIWKWVLPRVNTLLEERRQQIQGEIERAEDDAERGRSAARRLPRAAGGCARRGQPHHRGGTRTADQLRRDLQAKAEEEASATVARAQDEIRAERDRVFEDLRAQIGDIAVELAARVVNQSLDKKAHEKLIDDYIEQVASVARAGLRACRCSTASSARAARSPGTRRRWSRWRRPRVPWTGRGGAVRLRQGHRSQPAAARGADRSGAAGGQPAGAGAGHPRGSSASGHDQPDLVRDRIGARPGPVEDRATRSSRSPPRRENARRRSPLGRAVDRQAARAARRGAVHGDGPRRRGQGDRGSIGGRRRDRARR